MLGFFKKKQLNSVPGGGGWFPIIREPFAGAWQMNKEEKRETYLAHFAVFSCISIVESDISKLGAPRLVKEVDGIWNEIQNKKYKVIKKPNHYQNAIQFYGNWIDSKLIRGNTYILKGRNEQGNVEKFYVLNPDLTMPLVSPSGEVFYQLSQDNLSGVEAAGVIVPASEIIHDRFNCFYHPLVGLSPLYAAALAASNGISIQRDSKAFFDNLSQPGGILSAPGHIADETAKRIKDHWEHNYKGKNAGKVAVLGDDLKYTPLSFNAKDSMLVDQLKMTADIVCSVFHVPKYKVIGDAPSYNNVEALDQQYYSQCLQVLIESIELLLDEALEIPDGTGTEFDISKLLRMDSKTNIDANANAVKGGLKTPNEARKDLNLPALKGGNTVYMQEQNYSLEALAKRDAREDPFAKSEGSSDEGDDQPEEEPIEETEEDQEKQLMELSILIRQSLESAEEAA